MTAAHDVCRICYSHANKTQIRCVISMRNFVESRRLDRVTLARVTIPPSPTHHFESLLFIPGDCRVSDIEQQFTNLSKTATLDAFS